MTPPTFDLRTEDFVDDTASLMATDIDVIRQFVNLNLDSMDLAQVNMFQERFEDLQCKIERFQELLEEANDRICQIRGQLQGQASKLKERRGFEEHRRRYVVDEADNLR